MSRIDDFKAKFPQAGRTGASSTNAAPVQSSSVSKPEINTQENTSAAPKTQKKNTLPQRPSTPRFNNELPKEVAADLHTYLYTDAADYSDAVADYIVAEDKSPRDKVSHALNMLDYMRDEFKKRPDKSQPKPLRVSRRKITEMAVMLYYDNKAESKVAAKTEKFLTRISEVSGRDYVRNGKDSFLGNLLKAYQKNAPRGDEDLLWDKIFEQHIQGVLGKIEKQEDKNSDEILKDKLKYARFLSKNNFEDYIPEELAAELNKPKKENSDKPKQPKDKTSEPKTGDKPMTDEVKDEVINEEQNTDDTPKFTLTKAQLWAAEHAGFNWKECKDAEEVMSKIKDAGYAVEGDKVFKLGEGDAKEVVAEYDKDKDIMIDKKEEELAKEAFEAGLKDYPKEEELAKVFAEAAEEEELRKTNAAKPALTAEALDPEKKDDTHEDEPEKPLDWVQKKIRDYKAMEAEGKISNVVINEELKTEFEAQVEGGTIHYSSPDNVSISNDAKIKTFEAVMMEPDNLGRPINFGENMPHDMAVRLVAACVLHGNKMQGSVPDLSAEDMQMLQGELGERFGDFQKKLAEMNKPKEERTGEEKPAEEKPAEEKPTEEKVKLSTAEELGKAAESLKGIKEQFEQMKNDGLIAVTTNVETKKPEIVAGPALEGKPEEEQKKVVDDANALIASAAAIVQSSKTVSGKLNEEQAKQNNEFNQERLDHIRKTMDQKKLAEHDAMTPEARVARLAQMREDMSVKLGITTDPKGENKALTDEALTDYISQGKITIKNYADLWEKANEGKKFDIKELKPEEKAVFMQISKAQLDRRNALMGKEASREK